MINHTHKGYKGNYIKQLVTLPQFYPKTWDWGKHLCLTIFTPILPQLLP